MDCFLKRNDAILSVKKVTDITTTAARGQLEPYGFFGLKIF